MLTAEFEKAREERALADMFMRQVRRNHAKRGKSLSGPVHLTDEQNEAIRRAELNPEVTAILSGKNIEGIVHNMMTRFEEMCRRQGQSVRPNIRPHIIALLADELIENMYALETDKPEQLESFTLYHGATAQALIDDPKFKSFHVKPVMSSTRQRVPGIFRYAIYQNPTDAEFFLDKVRIEARKILSHENEFSVFRPTPYIVVHAVARHPKDPRAFLRGVNAQTEVILAMPEYADFKDKPLVVRHAVAFNHTTISKALDEYRKVHHMEHVEDNPRRAEIESALHKYF